MRVRSNAIRERAHAFYLRDGYRRVKTSAVFEKLLSSRTLRWGALTHPRTLFETPRQVKQRVGKKIAKMSNPATLKRHTCREEEGHEIEWEFRHNDIRRDSSDVHDRRGGSAPLPCIACEVTTSYHAAVRVYDRARLWGEIARWWIDPEYVPTARRTEPPTKPEDVCEARPADRQ